MTKRLLNLFVNLSKTGQSDENNRIRNTKLQGGHDLAPWTSHIWTKPHGSCSPEVPEVTTPPAVIINRGDKKSNTQKKLRQTETIVGKCKKSYNSLRIISSSYMFSYYRWVGYRSRIDLHGLCAGMWAIDLQGASITYPYLWSLEFYGRWTKKIPP